MLAGRAFLFTFYFFVYHPFRVSNELNLNQVVLFFFVKKGQVTSFHKCNFKIVYNFISVKRTTTTTKVNFTVLSFYYFSFEVKPTTVMVKSSFKSCHVINFRFLFIVYSEFG